MKKMTYEEKKQLAIKYIKTFDIDIDGLLQFYKFYSFSTENLTDYFNKELLENKKVLITGSSSDQIITSQLFDAKMITNYDINPLVEFIYDLKIAAIKELDIDEFINYFYYRNINESSLSYKQYDKIRKHLNNNSLDFWDTLYDKFKPLKIREKLFVCTDEPADRYIYKRFIPYLKDENYYLIKNKDLIPVEFVNCNVLNIPKNIDNNYDLIYFSNIFSRFEMFEFYENHYIKNLYKFLRYILDITNENGKIILDYLYNVKKDERFNKDFHRIYFPIRIFNCEKNISYKEISSIFDGSTINDTILIYTKKNK